MAFSINHDHFPLGYCNWGRGVGWWAIALSDINIEDLSEDVQNIIDKFNDTLKTIWEEDGKFTQLIRQSDEIDLSATMPILYYLYHKRIILLTENDVNRFGQYFHNGCLRANSAGNYGLLISPFRGANPISDAFLLKIVNEMIMRNDEK